MGRSRSRSPAYRRDRRRSRSRSKDRDRRRDRRRSRSPKRKRSPPRRRSRSPRRRSRSPERGRERFPSYDSTDCVIVDDTPTMPNGKELSEAELEGKTEDEIDMMKVMGFSGFETTKGKHVKGNDIYNANISHKRKYRQYMNRKGGFNRPLDFIA